MSALAPGGFTWTTVAVTALNLMFGGVLVAFIRSRVPMRKVVAEREANLLEERAKEMASMRDRMEKLEQKLAIAEEEVRLVRHDLANTNQVFDFYIARVKADPAKAAELATEVELRREDQRRRLEEERSRLRQARVAVITGKGALP